ncbi:hypothetical protein AZE42_10415 [Rhizopogon vesiculosus]|uniref:Uncharacterized protein n=1 Tax=Rhizopogon vesiculosus TaxID=180088 RepID=A0A1J8QJE1_9AGAM|nr:hypothetical protein AZE42_10415 [Rhizopogon vesiculosus]
MRVPLITGPQYQDIGPRKGGGGGGKSTVATTASKGSTSRSSSRGKTSSAPKSRVTISSPTSRGTTRFINRCLLLFKYVIQWLSSMYGSGYPEDYCPVEFSLWLLPIILEQVKEAHFISSSTGTTFRLLSDNCTVTSLISSIKANCSSNLASSTSKSPSPFPAPGGPQPEQAIQYYRSYSIVLTLDGYNNLNSPNTSNSPLPSGIDTTLLNCLNYTIGQAAPPFDGASMHFTSPPCLGAVSFVWILWLLLHYA